MTPLDFNIISVTNAWNENQEMIQSYLNDPEGFDASISEQNKTVMGVAIGVFIVLFIAIIIMFFWSIYALLKHWNYIPSWAKAVGLLGVFFFPLLTLIVVYATTTKKE